MIKFDNVFKSFDGLRVLENLSLEIPRGAAYGLLGTNGAGKSTLLRLLSGVYKTDGGSVTIGGEPVWDNVSVKRRLLLVSDETAQFDRMTLKQMRKFYKTFYPAFSDETFEQMHGVIGLPLDKKLSGFSKGMKRQAAMMCGIAASPDYLLLDEAFDGLDPTMRAAMKKMLVNAMCDKEMTIVASSHDLKEVEEFCDTVGVLHEGKMLFSRALDELKGSVHKVQCAMGSVPDKSDFPELDILLIEESCGTVNIIARGDADKTLKAVGAKADCNLLPLSLEEIFVYEMEALNYDRSKLV
ncbi:MAG: ABC transporter ATP-binding protein [Lachnospiraceae bacterium]|nr:ABC transporter ATP-binding protein [Ruminococcus sp.]MCM1274565.1 ABC transporter ATP-binding protein [Lachnospiraceae bacterium]